MATVWKKKIFIWASMCQLNIKNSITLVQESAHYTMGQIRPKGWFQVTYKLRMVFTFLSGWKKNQKENNIPWCENYVKFKFQYP